MKCMVNMKIYEVKERTELLMEQLLKVWEESVRATHQFLSEKEIEKIKEFSHRCRYYITGLTIVTTQGVTLTFTVRVISAGLGTLDRSFSLNCKSSIL